MNYDVLDQVKTLLGIDTGDIDKKLEIIIGSTESRLKLLLSEEEVPEAMQHIITEVSIKRYNKIGSEGMKSLSVEGESMTFEDDDFAEFQSEIDTYLAKKSSKGIVRFI